MKKGNTDYLLPTTYTVHGTSELPAPGISSESRFVLLDGAMGTELARRGANTGLPLWSANALIEQPELVLRIHRDYIAAGADIITTNTFRTTRRTFVKAGLPDRSFALTRLAVQLAMQARNKFPKRTVWIAGSMAPLEDCYRPDLVPADEELAREHTEHAWRLADANVDLLLCETIGTVREAVAAAKAAAATKKPFVVSFLCNSKGDLYNGEPLETAVRQIEPLKPAAFSMNCLSPHFMDQAIGRLRAATALPFGVYGNVGIPGEEQAGLIRCDVGPEEYAAYALRWQESGAWMIGGCCGTTPEYVRRLHEKLRR